MTDDLRARIEAALGLHPAIRNGQTIPLTNAVMEIVQLVAARLAEQENAINWETSCLSCARILDSCHAETTRAEQAEAERDRLRWELRDAEAQRDPLVVNEASDSYLIGRQVASAGMYNTVLRRAMKAEAEWDGRREVERSHAEAAIQRVRDWLSQWGPQLPDGACHTLDQALDGPPDRSTAAAIDETYRYEPPNCQCGHGAEYHGPEAGCIECRCALTLIKAAQPVDERTTPNNPPTSSDTVDLSGHDVRCPSCRELLGQFIKTEAQAGVLVADHTC